MTYGTLLLSYFSCVLIFFQFVSLVPVLLYIYLLIYRYIYIWNLLLFCVVFVSCVYKSPYFESMCTLMQPWTLRIVDGTLHGLGGGLFVKPITVNLCLSYHIYASVHQWLICLFNLSVSTSFLEWYVWLCYVDKLFDLKCMRYNVRAWQTISALPSKVPVVSLSKKHYPHCLVLVGFRNRFTTELK